MQTRLDAGAARNALDCALWDLEAKLTGNPVSKLSGLTPPETFTTLRTVVIDTPEAMAAEAAGYANGAPLKVKLDQNLVAERLSAVQAGAPASPIVVDANEAWTPGFLKRMMPRLKALGVVLLEQPLAAGARHQ